MADKITRETTIQEVANNYPEVLAVFMKYGLGCIGCHLAAFENVEQGAMAHGINVDDLIRDLNAAVDEAATE